jgi:hypothetical protein
MSEAESLPGVAVLTAEQLRAVVRDAVEAALNERLQPTEPRPELVDGVTLAARLGVSRATVYRLRLRGLPAVPVGDVFRYRVADAVAWLRSGGARVTREKTVRTNGQRAIGIGRSRAGGHASGQSLVRMPDPSGGTPGDECEGEP